MLAPNLRITKDGFELHFSNATLLYVINSLRFLIFIAQGKQLFYTTAQKTKNSDGLVQCLHTSEQTLHSPPNRVEFT
jgi:hypothetical protein